ncbi:MAG: tRNA (adenosine(37)-N6)-threonylcarbamoyltransferase complex ATPase subunit type 1 TsaE [Candidatus Paceibacterota bacterium]|jgi:tRNA threonylcarbamoyladenosine biosynthesis protein TsaE|nr:tRNA (adenosine(37)-N6)-threonylcarbamoyltransferase complex ATPase subunit type 1 TsaE [Candidatus Paceibacterota bacterium]MDD5555439.1 tRNA (adenosine(37)-N6)-threonylcarbamoyltransferase complex ATPase subunit type 1 TsaE [Candidatus Paceibacterota bacterium]
MEIISCNSSETKRAGKELALKILSAPEKRRVLALKGGLGAGKTTFLQGFAKGLNIRKKILSPTFVIFNRFKLKSPYFENFYHFDCYRIENFKEMESLGFKEIVSSPKNIVAIEWPEKIKKILPRKIIELKFKILGEDKRKIIID